MDEATMLETLSEHGQDAGSDYNDSDDVMGYFGWSIAGGVLTVTHEPDDDVVVVRRWRLTLDT